jgi:HEAT repeat protein
MTSSQPSSREPVNKLLRNALIKGDELSFDELVSAGPIAVDEFVKFVSAEPAVPLSGGRAFVDNIMAVSCALASRFPDKFLAAFDSDRWESSGFVLEGLGCTELPEARRLLTLALFSDLPGTTRLSAASALGSIPGPESVQALLRALDDLDYLVKYHAIKSLGMIGDLSVLDRLTSLIEASGNPGIARSASQAAEAIRSRFDPS